MTKNLLLPALIAGFLSIATTPALAVGFDSAFVTYNFDECISRGSKSTSSEILCPADKNVPQYVSTIDSSGQLHVSYGVDARSEEAADQTLPGAVSVAPDVEWRLNDKTGEWQAFAAIQRWFTKDERGITGETLVITKIEKGSTCHTAYIDAVVTPKVEQRARKIADLCTPKFRCGMDTPMLVSGIEDPKAQKTCSRSWSGLFSR